MKTILLAFVIKTCLIMQSSAQSFDSLFIQSHVEKLENAKLYTLKVAELMPEKDYSFKAEAAEMSFGEQLLHITANLAWLSSSYIVKAENPLNKKDATSASKKDIVTEVAMAYDFAIASIKKMPVAELSTTVEFFSGSKNKLQIINLLEDHQTHHRAQILVYLRLKGIIPPSYVGW